MSKKHFEVLHEAGVEMPSEKSTGLVFSGVCAIAAVLLRSHEFVALALLAGSGVFAFLAFHQPGVLKPLNAAWFALALALNKIVSPVVMFVLFAFVVVPAGLIMQLVRDPLQRKRSVVRSSYWIERDPTQNKSTMRDQF